jgi:hypothetical protein
LAFQWTFPAIAAIAFFTIQISAALHYWPISALSFGILLLAFLYASNSLFTSLARNQSLREAAIEPLIALSGFSVLAILIS